MTYFAFVVWNRGPGCSLRSCHFCVSNQFIKRSSRRLYVGPSPRQKMENQENDADDEQNVK